MEYSEPNERLKDESRCASIRAELKMCLLKTDCCKIVSNLSQNNLKRALFCGASKILKL